MRYAICILLLVVIGCTAVSADDTIKDYYSSLPNGVTEVFPKDFEEKLEEDSVSALETLDAEYVLTFLLDTLKSALRESASDVGMLVCIIIISSVMLSFSDNIPYKPMLAVSSFSVIGCMLETIKPMTELVKTQLEGTGTIMKLSIPVMTAVGTAAGQPSSSVVNALWLNTALTLMQQLTESILFPLISVCVALTVASSIARFNGNNSLNGTVVTLKKTFIFLITLISVVFTTIMSFQNIVAKGSDTVLLRSIKFASGSAIPIIGGALSEAAGAYLSGVSLVKGSLGTLCAVCIVISVLPIIVRLFALKIALSFSAFLCDILGGTVSADIREFTSIIDLLISVSVLCSMMFMIAAGTFASTLPA